MFTSMFIQIATVDRQYANILSLHITYVQNSAKEKQTHIEETRNPDNETNKYKRNGGNSNAQFW